MMPWSRVAIQGERGSFSECAALLLVDGAIPIPKVHPEDLFIALENGEADCAVVPIENVQVGSVFSYYDLMLRYADVRRRRSLRIKIARELVLNIHHNLVCHPDASMKNLTAVRSHSHALAQCAAYIARHGFERHEHTDTASALERIKREGLLDVAAIASAQAARDFGMKIIDSEIQDREHNYTRFLLLASIVDLEPTGPIVDTTKMSVAFCIDNKAGSLFNALSVFASRGLDVIRLETRPIYSTSTDWIDFSAKPWDLIYQADVAGNITDCKNAIDHLGQMALRVGDRVALSVLGYYVPHEHADEVSSGRIWRH